MRFSTGALATDGSCRTVEHVRRAHMSVLTKQHTGNLVLVSVGIHMSGRRTYSRRDEILADHCDYLLRNAKDMRSMQVMEERSLALAECREMMTETVEEAGMPRLGSCLGSSRGEPTSSSPYSSTKIIIEFNWINALCI